jgi:hypothetical protein
MLAMSFIQSISIPPRNLRSLETKHLRRDLTGHKFGRLFIISFSHMQGKVSFWVCACSRGNIKIVRGGNLTSSTTRSCGCLKVEHVRKKMIAKIIIHGMATTRLYRIWHQMISRCYNKRNNRYKVYGARGITVCPAWRSNFLAFREWALSNSYKDDLQIDRRKNNEGYSPSNCRFVTAKQNSNNRRGSKLYVFRGRLLNQSDIAKEIGIHPSSFSERLRRGQSIDEAVRGVLRRRRHRQP